MRVVISLIASSILLGSNLHAQVGAPTETNQATVLESLTLECDRSSVWNDGDTRTVLARGSVKVVIDGADAHADSAVIWITQRADQLYDVKIALIGNAKVTRDSTERSGDRLLLTTTVRPQLDIQASELIQKDERDDPIYQAASNLRDANVQTESGVLSNQTSNQTFTTPPATPTRQSTTPTTPKTAGRAGTPVSFHAKHAQMTRTDDGNVAIVLDGDVLLIQTLENGDRIELRGERAVLFTTVTDVPLFLRSGGLQSDDARSKIESAYLEGAVNIDYTPATANRPEQRLRAARVLYDFIDERAILTDALLQTRDPATDIPLTVRAQEVRKIGEDEYEARKAQISTSTFATPSFSLRSTRVHVRRGETDPDQATQTNFRADNVTLNAYGIPFFYLPVVGGSVTERGSPLRDLAITGTKAFGIGVESTWGLFESFGSAPPRGLDAELELDYFTQRGPAIGVNADYSGSYIDKTTRTPWSFDGDFSSYLVYDEGEDRPGGDRRRIPHEGDFRGKLLWEHQHFFPQAWQIQLRAGWVSDITYLGEWERPNFYNDLPYETSLYLKRQQDSELLTLLVSADLPDLPTSAGQLQESIDYNGQRRTVQIEKLPEITYQRIGDSLGGEVITWNSNNTLSGLQASIARSDLGGDLGFRKGSRFFNPGVPSYAYTGAEDEWMARADFRQEVAFPLALGPVKTVPYLMGRYTAWSDSPDGSDADRAFVGGGARMSMQFWRIFPDARSRLFDINGLRHIIEPELHLFASAQNQDRDDLFVYEEQIDGISDIQLASFVLHQRWQTKRGANDRLRNVDVLSFDLGLNLFANEPDEIESFGSDQPNNARAFRGLFLPSAPETSIARDGAFVTLNWRVTDTTALLGDASYNLTHSTLATAALGLAVARDPRLRYFIGTRYIGEINSTIASLRAEYEISPKYSLNGGISFSLNGDKSQNANMTVTRRFDQFALMVGAYYDQVENEGGLRISFSPLGTNFSIGSDRFVAR